jgi:hypothetical protein
LNWQDYQLSYEDENSEPRTQVELQANSKRTPSELQANSKRPLLDNIQYTNIQNTFLREKKIPDKIKQEWENTLKHYSKEPNWIRDEVTLVRLYLVYQNWDRIENALIGFRKEEASERYRPEKFVYLDRLSDKKKFSFLENLGEQSKIKEKEEFKNDEEMKEHLEIRRQIKEEQIRLGIKPREGW